MDDDTVQKYIQFLVGKEEVKSICFQVLGKYRYLSIEKKLRHDKIFRQFFVSDLSNLMATLVTTLVPKAIPTKKPK